MTPPPQSPMCTDTQRVKTQLWHVGFESKREYAAEDCKESKCDSAVTALNGWEMRTQVTGRRS